jgi:hypothetical protein
VVATVTITLDLIQMAAAAAVLARLEVMATPLLLHLRKAVLEVSGLTGSH